jgi:predicted membrane-bound spermidine synthase
MRDLRLIFGATTAAVAAVLAIFMAGLGVGSAVLGKRADRVAKPLFMYGVLEIAIAISVAVSPWLLAIASSIYIGLSGQAALGMTTATVVRLLLATAVMGVPAFLMGGTLPAAVRAVTTTSDSHRRALGLLYGANTLGAVIGTAAATLLFLEVLGTRATLYLGCAIGLLVGSISVAWSRRLQPLTEYAAPDAGTAAVGTEVDDAESSPHRPRLIYVTAAVLGFAFFALELVWYRMLAPILGGTAFTFGLILCMALLGIGLGGVAYNVVFTRWKPTWSALGITCACEAFFAILPFALGDRLAIQAARNAASATSFTTLAGGWCVIIGIVVFPIAFVSGLQFPLLTGLLGHGRRTVSEHLGNTYAWNTAGAIAGSLVAGFGGMPLLSATGLWQAIAALLSVLTICVLIGAPRAERGRGMAIAAAIVVIALLLMRAEGPTAAWRHGSVGAGRDLPPADFNAVQCWLNAKRWSIIWQADGVESSVGIDGNDGLAFIVNGKSDGNALSDMATQVGAPLLGAVLHKDPKSALVIGLGTGESAGWLAESRQMEHVDVVELEPAIDEMALRCRDLNFDVLQHPRVRRIYADGREYVFTTSNTYDVIFSEPSNPYRAGVAALYTAEFYDAVRRRLNPGGIFVQWLQAYEVDAVAVSTVLATARSAFSHIEIWQTLGTDMQLVCSNTPITYSVDELKNRIGSGTVKEGLATAWHVHDIEGFLGHFVANSKYVDAVAQIPLMLLNTDDRTILEYSFAKTVGLSTPFSIEAMRGQLKDAGYHQPAIVGNVDWHTVEVRRQISNWLLAGQLSGALLPEPDDQTLIQCLTLQRNRMYAEVVKGWPAAYAKSTEPLLNLVLAQAHAEIGSAECLSILKSAESRYPIDAAAVQAVYYFRAKEFPKALQAMESFFSMLTKSPWALNNVSDSVFDRAVDLSRADKDAAKRIHTALLKPFPSNRFNGRRQQTLALVAWQVGPQETTAALADLEPNVPWTGKFLQIRAESYAATQNPLARQAQRDWELFQKHMTAN